MAYFDDSSNDRNHEKIEKNINVFHKHNEFSFYHSKSPDIYHIGYKFYQYCLLPTLLFDFITCIITFVKKCGCFYSVTLFQFLFFAISLNYIFFTKLASNNYLFHIRILEVYTSNNLG